MNIKNAAVVSINKKSLLSAVVNKIFIETCIEKTIDKLSSEMMESRDLMMDNFKVDGKDFVSTDGVVVARFNSEKMANYISKKSPISSNKEAIFALEKVNRFNDAWGNNDIDTQKEIFEGVYVIVAYNMGEEMATHMKRAFIETISFRSLQDMIDPIASGLGNHSNVRKSKETSVADNGSEVDRYTLAIQLLLDTASKDEYGIELKEIVYTAAKNWTLYLRNSKDPEKRKQADILLGVLPVFERVVLLPESTGRKVTIKNTNEF